MKTIFFALLVTLSVQANALDAMVETTCSAMCVRHDQTAKDNHRPFFGNLLSYGRTAHLSLKSLHAQAAMICGDGAAIVTTADLKKSGDMQLSFDINKACSN